jgi:hypothetical protein
MVIVHQFRGPENKWPNYQMRISFYWRYSKTPKELGVLNGNLRTTFTLTKNWSKVKL